MYNIHPNIRSEFFHKSSCTNLNMYYIGIFLELKTVNEGHLIFKLIQCSNTSFNLKCLGPEYWTLNYVTSNYPVLSVNTYRVPG
jgi:hypothetical protein